MKKLVRLFLRGKKVNPNQRDISGYTALYWCSRYGDADLVRLLLDHPSIDLQSDNHGRDALACAAAEGHEEIVQWPVGHDEIQMNDHDGLSGYALFKAVARGHEKVVDCLLSRQDLNPNLTSYFRDITPLIEAVRKGHENIVRSLLNFPATDPNARTWSTPPLFVSHPRKAHAAW
jgi:ankyrin repeat protein